MARRSSKATLLEQVDEPNPSGIGNPGIGIIYPANLWPNAGNIFQIPYTITVGDQKVTDSITSFNNIFSGFMQWVPRTTETDYVDFNLDVNNHSGSWRKKGHLNFLDGPSPGLQTSVPTIHR